jgi:hypothetical protein
MLCVCRARVYVLTVLSCQSCPVLSCHALACPGLAYPVPSRASTTQVPKNAPDGMQVMKTLRGLI